MAISDRQSLIGIGDNKKKNKQEVPKSVSFIVIILAIVVAVYFIFFSGSSSSSSFNKKGTQIVNEVVAPDVINAPVLMLPDVRDLEIFDSELVKKNQELVLTEKEADIAEAKLKKVNAENKMGSQIDLNNMSPSSFGMGISLPDRTMTEPLNVNQLPTVTLPSSFSNSTHNANVSLVSISKVNKQLEATLNFNGSLVAVNRRGVVYHEGKKPALRVKSLTDSSVCITVNKETTCYKVN